MHALDNQAQDSGQQELVLVLLPKLELE